MTLTLYRIEPLTGANYRAWKLKLHWVLIEQDLWGHVTRNVVRPVPADVNAVTAAEQQSIDDWERKDQQAYAAICLRISDKYIVYTYNTTTAKKVWDRHPRDDLRSQWTDRYNKYTMGILLHICPRRRKYGRTH